MTAAQAVHSSTCNNAVYEAVGAARTDRNCSSGLVWWTVVFSFFELFLSQIPDFHSLWWALLSPFLLLHSCNITESNPVTTLALHWLLVCIEVRAMLRVLLRVLLWKMLQGQSMLVREGRLS